MTDLAPTVAVLADVAAENFLDSLGVQPDERERAIIVHSYVVGWIQGVYAGANEQRPNVCRRRTIRRPHLCSRKGRL